MQRPEADGLRTSQRSVVGQFMASMGAPFAGMERKSDLVQITAQRSSTKASAKIGGIADKKVDADAIDGADDVGPFGIVDVAVALKVAERYAAMRRQTADRRLLLTNRRAIFQRHLLQRRWRLLIKRAHMRLGEPLREDRKIGLRQRAEIDGRRYRFVHRSDLRRGLDRGVGRPPCAGLPSRLPARCARSTP